MVYMKSYCYFVTESRNHFFFRWSLFISVYEQVKIVSDSQHRSFILKKRQDQKNVLKIELTNSLFVVYVVEILASRVLSENC